MTSRSQLKRIAAQKGEPMPEFDEFPSFRDALVYLAGKLESNNGKDYCAYDLDWGRVERTLRSRRLNADTPYGWHIVTGPKHSFTLYDAAQLTAWQQREDAKITPLYTRP